MDSGEEQTMLKNNIELDVKVKCIEKSITQVQIAKIIGTTAPYVCRILKAGDKVINKTFIQMMEALGYDIELKYIKRKTTKTKGHQ